MGIGGEMTMERKKKKRSGGKSGNKCRRCRHFARGLGTCEFHCEPLCYKQNLQVISIHLSNLGFFIIYLEIFFANNNVLTANIVWLIIFGQIKCNRSTVALQQEGPGFDSQPGVFLHGVCMFSPCMCGFSPGTPASSHSPKTCLLG
ncbi:hypothetical protein AMECASPLE_010112 [Ameca splendens]|uniref:Uncharacterized protein n=1 Tax=Ameca splendens TaxID=208324 RepID=A0ABV0XPC7_9TELE